MMLLVAIVTGAKADTTELFSADFTSSTWTGKTFSQGNTETADVINGITFYSKSSSKQFSLTDNTTKGLTFPSNNINSSNYFFAIPLEGVDTKVYVTIVPLTTTDKKSRVKYDLKQTDDAPTVAFSSIGTSTDAQATTNGGNITFEVAVTKKNAVLYIGRYNSNAENAGILGISVSTEAAEAATEAPATPTFSVDGGNVDGKSTVTIASANATKIFYQWSNDATAPAAGDESYTVVNGDSYEFKIPNATATKYLHAYGWNNYNTSTNSEVKSATFKVSKITFVKTWNFTNTPADVLEALGNTDNWNYSDPRYTNNSAVADKTDLGSITAASWSGIQIGKSGSSISAGNLRINKNAYIQINGSNFYYIIKDLEAGDVVKVRCQSANQTSDRSLTVSGATPTSASAPQSNNGYADTELTVSSDGDLTLTNNGGGINVMAIAVNEELPAVPTVAVSTSTGNTYATYVTSTALDFSTVSDEITAYIVTADNTSSVTTEAVEKVPANTALLIKTAEAGASVSVPYATGATAISNNKLKYSSSEMNITDAQATAKQYYGFFKVGGKYGFAPMSAGTLAAKKAYLDYGEEGNTLQFIALDFESEATAVEAIAEANEADAAAPVKVIKNGKFYIGNYNVAGQQVK